MTTDADIKIGSVSLAVVFARLDLSSDARAEVTRIDRLLAAELGRPDVDPETVASMVFRAADVVAADAGSAADVADVFDDDVDWWHFDVDAADVGEE